MKGKENQDFGIYIGASLGMTGIKLLMGSTTGIAGYAVGLAVFGGSIYGGYATAIILMLGLDGVMGALFKYLLRDNPLKIAWMITIFFSLMSALATWFSGKIIGAAATDRVTAKEAGSMIAELQKDRDKEATTLNNRIAIARADIKDYRSKITDLTKKRDKALNDFLEGLPSRDHAQRIADGSYSAYYGKRAYRTLSSNVDQYFSIRDQYNDEIDKYNGWIDGKQSLINQLSVAGSEDKSAADIVSQIVADDNANQDEVKATVTTFVQILDPVLLLMLWGSFIFIRDLVRKNPDLRNSGWEFSPMAFITNRLNVWAKKASETETPFDDYVVEALKGIVSILGLPFKFFGFASTLFSGVLIMIIEGVENAIFPDDDTQNVPNDTRTTQNVPKRTIFEDDTLIGQPNIPEIQELIAGTLESGTHKSGTRTTQNVPNNTRTKPTPKRTNRGRGADDMVTREYKGKEYNRSGINNLISSKRSYLKRYPDSRQAQDDLQELLSVRRSFPTAIKHDASK